MTKIHFTLDQLIVLEASVRTGSFASAAKELYRVPSAISYSISSLEYALGLTLFDRSKRKAQLTKEGHRIYKEAMDIISVGEKLQKLSSRFKDGWESELQIIVDGIIPMNIITTALQPFSNLEIPTRIRLDIEYQEGVPDRFFADRADLMIILDFTDDTGALEVFPLPQVEVILVASSQHPLAKMEHIQPEDLQTYMDLVVRDSSPKYIRQARESSFMNSKNLLFLSDFHSKRLALLDNVGYGWMPRYLIEQDLNDERLKQLNLEVNSWKYSPSLVKVAAEPLGRAGNLFVDTLLNHQIN